MSNLERRISLDIDDAETCVRKALAEQGFGVLSEIDVAAALRDKLGVEGAPLKILGACNPHLAHEALQRDPSVALVLPCNVVLEAADTDTRVTAADPHEIMSDPRFADLADDASRRLEAALASLPEH